MICDSREAVQSGIRSEGAAALWNNAVARRKMVLGRDRNEGFVKHSEGDTQSHADPQRKQHRLVTDFEHDDNKVVQKVNLNTNKMPFCKTKPRVQESIHQWLASSTIEHTPVAIHLDHVRRYAGLCVDLQFLFERFGCNERAGAASDPSRQVDLTIVIENDDSLLSPGKTHADQMRELVIKPPLTLRFCEEFYVIIVDALDECFSWEEAARLVVLLTDTLVGPDLPFIHVIFTSRPEAHIRAAIPSGVYEILLTTRDKKIPYRIQDTGSSSHSFCQLPTPWPLEDEFETLAFKAGGLFVYAAMAMNFISAPGHPREKSTVGADIDQLYRQIIVTSGDLLYGQTIAASEDPLVHCRMLASIVHLDRPLALAELQELFYPDERSLDMMLQALSPVILNDGIRHVEIYHASLWDFLRDPLRSQQYYVDAAHADEYLACCCLDFITRQDSTRTRAILALSPLPRPYPYQMWHVHLYLAYPGSKLRDLLALFTETTLRYWVQVPRPKDFHLPHTVLIARKTCLSSVVVFNMLDYEGCVLTMNFPEMDQGSVRHCGCVASS
ncbi:hypothetical protein BDR04DRAFT_1145486 [Suillus decipiens]|nr:hypothetical protein BDR04DRAFT_1145486 [Suillus decipiens]